MAEDASSRVNSDLNFAANLRKNATIQYRPFFTIQIQFRIGKLKFFTNRLNSNNRKNLSKNKATKEDTASSKK